MPPRCSPASARPARPWHRSGPPARSGPARGRAADRGRWRRGPSRPARGRARQLPDRGPQRGRPDPRRRPRPPGRGSAAGAAAAGRPAAGPVGHHRPSWRISISRNACITGSSSAAGSSNTRDGRSGSSARARHRRPHRPARGGRRHLLSRPGLSGDRLQHRLRPGARPADLLRHRRPDLRRGRLSRPVRELRGVRSPVRTMPASNSACAVPFRDGPGATRGSLDADPGRGDAADRARRPLPRRRQRPRPAQRPFLRRPVPRSPTRRRR